MLAARAQVEAAAGEAQTADATTEEKAATRANRLSSPASFSREIFGWRQGTKQETQGLQNNTARANTNASMPSESLLRAVCF